MLSDILARHPGPYRFCLTRAFVGRPGFHTTQWLPRAFSDDQIENVAIRILSANPHRPVEGIGVWSEREQLFVTEIRGGQDL